MAVDKQQFQLPLTVNVGRPSGSVPASRERAARPLPARVAGIDQVLSTRDVEQITGKHRCTIYRWVCAGTFPPKRAGGGRGWLRSDIERWLSGGASDERQTSISSDRVLNAAPKSSTGQRAGSGRRGQLQAS